MTQHPPISPRPPRRALVALPALAAVALALLSPLWSPWSLRLGTADAHTRITTDVTWGEDVRPILRQHCMRCHSPGGTAPSYADFTTYGTDARPGARAWATAIEEELLTGHMPPWTADPRYGRFANARQLTKEEQDILLAWISGGAPQGPRRNLPAPAEFAQDAWELGTPDIVVQGVTVLALPSDSETGTQTLRFKNLIANDTWLTGYEFKPRSVGAVQRITAWIIDSHLEPEELEVEIQVPYDPFRDENEPEPTRMRATPQGRKLLGQYLPGDVPTLYPAGAGKRLRAGTIIEVETVYRRRRSDVLSGMVHDQSSLGLFLAQSNEEVDLITETLTVGAKALTRSKRQLREGLSVIATLPEEARLIALNPRFDGNLASIETVLIYPDGREKTVLFIQDHSDEWPSSYHFDRPMPVPEGTRVAVRATLEQGSSKKSWTGDLQLSVDYLLTDHLVLPFIVDPDATAQSSGGMLIGATRPDGSDTLSTPSSSPPTSTDANAAAHMDHRPLHGGQFFMAANQYHHVEGTLPEAGEFRIFVYDDFKRPIDPRNFAGTVIFERYSEATGDFTEEPYPMTAEPGTLYLRAAIPQEMPAEFFASVVLAGKPLRFDFYFEETTAEPVAVVGRGTAGPVGDHAHTRPPLTIPTTASDIARELKIRSERIEQRMSRGDWLRLYVPAFDGRDLAEALIEKLDGIRARQRGQVRKAIARIMQSAAELDRAGDLADAGRARKALLRFDGAVREIAKILN